MQIWRELKQRKVVRIVTVYALVGWLVIQIAATVFAPLQLPSWSLTFLIIVVILGFPLTFILAWATHKTQLPKTVEDIKPVIKSVKKVIHEKSIAVLPFLNMSHDPGQEYFADGITENILTQLAGIEELKVISRTSVMRYKNTLKSVTDIANELEVNYILEGSAQSQGDKVRINVQLISGSNDHHLWAKVFDEDLKDIFAIQNAVAQQVVLQLKSTLGPVHHVKMEEIPSRNMAAYDAFLKGRYAWNSFTQESFHSAEGFFKQAIELDPEFTLAYSCLAKTYIFLMSWMGDLSPEEGFERASFYLKKARQKGASAMDCSVQSGIELIYYKNISQAIEWDKKALAIIPNDSQMMFDFSYHLSLNGRIEEAFEVIHKARKLDPVSALSLNQLGIACYLSGRYDDAIRTYRETIQLHPLAIRIYDHLAKVYLITSNYKLVIETLESGLLHTNLRPPSIIAYLAIAYLNEGEPDKQKKLLDELFRRNESGEKGIRIFLVQFYAFQNETDKAFYWLEKSFETNDADLFWLKMDPLFNNLRPFKEFTSFENRLGRIREPENIKH